MDQPRIISHEPCIYVVLNNHEIVDVHTSAQHGSHHQQILSWDQSVQEGAKHCDVVVENSDRAL